MARMTRVERDHLREAGGTLGTLADEFELAGILGLFEPLMARMVSRQYQGNLGTLKVILEARAAS